jgi:hypothetical protein
MRHNLAPRVLHKNNPMIRPPDNPASVSSPLRGILPENKKRRAKRLLHSPKMVVGRTAD